MEDRDKKMLIETVIEKVFIPDVMIAVALFITKAKSSIIYQHEYHQATGYQISAPPITLDLREAEDRMSRALVVALKENPNG